MPHPLICTVLLSLILTPLHLVENPGMRRVLSLVLSNLSYVICCYCSVDSCSVLSSLSYVICCYFSVDSCSLFDVPIFLVCFCICAWCKMFSVQCFRFVFYTKKQDNLAKMGTEASSTHISHPNRASYLENMFLRSILLFKQINHVNYVTM